MNRVYLDNAATTKVDKEVIEVMQLAMTDNFGNPSSVYKEARQARQFLENARKQVADLIKSQPEEIIFTCGGSESDNMALRGLAEARKKKGNHIITSKVEHHAVLHTCEYLEKNGFEVTYLPVDEYGMVSPEAVKAAIRPETILISIMYANNEVGTIMPIREIGAIAREHNVLLHTDAVQAIGQIDIDVKRDNIDFLSMSAHKIHGPKGAGALYIRKGLHIMPIIFGGGQEKGLRSGTENVPGFAGLGKACELAGARLEESHKKMLALRDKLIDGILQIPYTRLNGHPVKRLGNNVSVCINFIEGEGLLLRLDMAGISCSSGSACTSGSLDPSHVLLAMGLDHATAHGSLRFSLSHDTTEAEIDYVLEKLPVIAEQLRAMSPLYHSQLGECDRPGLRGGDCSCPLSASK